MSATTHKVIIFFAIVTLATSWVDFGLLIIGDIAAVLAIIGSGIALAKGDAAKNSTNVKGLMVSSAVFSAIAFVLSIITIAAAANLDITLAIALAIVCLISVLILLVLTSLAASRIQAGCCGGCCCAGGSLPREDDEPQMDLEKN